MCTQEQEDNKPVVHVTLGQLIAALEAAPTDLTILIEGGFAPFFLCSYRGHYGELAIVVRDHPTMTVGEFLPLATRAVGDVFEGWKGGSYEMTKGTPLWVTPDTGISSKTAVVRCEVRDDYFIIHTAIDLP